MITSLLLGCFITVIVTVRTASYGIYCIKKAEVGGGISALFLALCSALVGIIVIIAELY